jgi:hypothetical protein
MKMDVDFSELNGKTIRSVLGCKKGSEEIFIQCTDGSTFHLYHSQDCCEYVQVEDVTGDPADLGGAYVTVAEESYNKGEESWCESSTWTFYKIQTPKGDLTIRWLGESNGYYSESVKVDII